MIPLILLLINSASAWWCYGHMATAMIAYLDLQANNPDILAKAESLNSVFAGNNTDFKTPHIIGAACWPDDVKGRGLNAMNDWHYIDTPYSIDGTVPPTEISEGNALWAINKTMYTLKYYHYWEDEEEDLETKYTNNFEKSFALKYLIHIVGDLHQPLHATEMFSR
jgi:hypothetical protein